MYKTAKFPVIKTNKIPKYTECINCGKSDYLMCDPDELPGYTYCNSKCEGEFVGVDMTPMDDCEQCNKPFEPTKDLPNWCSSNCYSTWQEEQTGVCNISGEHI